MTLSCRTQKGFFHCVSLRLRSASQHRLLSLPILLSFVLLRLFPSAPFVAVFNSTQFRFCLSVPAPAVHTDAWGIQPLGAVLRAGAAGPARLRTGPQEETRCALSAEAGAAAGSSAQVSELHHIRTNPPVPLRHWWIVGKSGVFFDCVFFAFLHLSSWVSAFTWDFEKFELLAYLEYDWRSRMRVV